MLTEEWLLEAWKHQAAYITRCLEARVPRELAGQYTRPNQFQLAVGSWPGSCPQPLAFCHPADDCADGKTHTIFVSPLLAGDHRRTTTLFATLLHEQLHAWTGVQNGHNKKFQRIAYACGLRAPFNVVAADQINPALRREIHRLAKLLGQCPWKRMRRV